MKVDDLRATSMIKMKVDDLITPEKAATIVAEWRKPPLQAATLVKMASAGKFPSPAQSRYGHKRFRRSDVERWLREQLAPAPRRIVEAFESLPAGWWEIGLEEEEEGRE